MQKQIINIVTNSYPTLKELLTALILQLLLHNTIHHMQIPCILCTFVQFCRSYNTTLQKTANMKKAAEEVPTSQPRVVVTVGEQSDMKDAFLVIEKKTICGIPDTDLLLALLAAFYTFNMHYPEGCNNIYSLFEAALLGKKHPVQKTCLAADLATLSNLD